MPYLQVLNNRVGWGTDIDRTNGYGAIKIYHDDKTTYQMKPKDFFDSLFVDDEWIPEEVRKQTIEKMEDIPFDKFMEDLLESYKDKYSTTRCNFFEDISGNRTKHFLLRKYIFVDWRSEKEYENEQVISKLKKLHDEIQDALNNRHLLISPDVRWELHFNSELIDYILRDLKSPLNKNILIYFNELYKRVVKL